MQEKLEIEICFFYFSELSLQQSRSKRILEAMDVMYSEASKQSFASGKIFQKQPNRG